jgi:hypothetical protein
MPGMAEGYRNHGSSRTGRRTLRAVAALALSNGEAILLIALIAIPVAALSFLGAGTAFKQIGKGPLSIEQELPQKGASGPARISAEQRAAEIRQFLEAKAYRQGQRGEQPLDVDAELERLLASDAVPHPGLRSDAQLVAEVRELVEASNARRIRMGREPLDVEAEVERQLDELESLGQ